MVSEPINVYTAVAILYLQLQTSTGAYIGGISTGVVNSLLYRCYATFKSWFYVL